MSEDFVPREDAEFLPDDLQEGTHETGESIVDVPADVLADTRSSHKLHELTDRCLFSLAPLYQYARIPFSLPHQFAAEFPGGESLLKDLETHELSERLIHNVHDGFVLQSLSAPNFRRFMLWLSVVAFKSPPDTQISVGCDTVRVASPDCLPGTSEPPMVDVRILLPVNREEPHKVMRAVQSKKKISLVLGRYKLPPNPEYNP